MSSLQTKQHLHMVHELYKVGITNTDQHAGYVHPLNSVRAQALMCDALMGFISCVLLLELLLPFMGRY